MSAPCPQEVIDTGKDLIRARRLATNMSEAIDDALANLTKAVEAMKPHGAKAMQAGRAIANLRQAQAAVGLVMDAHDSLRHVLKACDVDEPTDAQVLSIR
jgi:hypothetical protein